MNMDYEIVNLKEKKIVGLSAVTSNFDKDMSEIIGGLWKDFYQQGFYQSIENKVNNKAIGLYSDYENKAQGKYTVTIGCEVEKAVKNREELTVKIIPEGRYAKFVVKGDCQKAVAEFWQKLWQMDIDRSFKGDFEEYQNSDLKNAVIDIYIALN